MNHKPILPPTYFWLGIIISLLFHFVLPVVEVIPFPWTFFGIVLMILGAVLNVWADQVFKKRSTTVKPFERPTVLVTDGPFAWSRHPMYHGMVAILLGISMICGSLSSFVGPLFYWLIIRFRFIPAEERLMAEVFGEQYNEYKRKVRSWV